MKEFKLNKSINVYYFTCEDENEKLFNDKDIVKYLNINMDFYRKTMMEKYEAFLYEELFIYFLDEEKAKVALHWLDSLLIVHRLSNH